MYEKCNSEINQEILLWPNEYQLYKSVVSAINAAYIYVKT